LKANTHLRAFRLLVGLGLVLALAPTVIRAEELVLKDGKTVVGTIVGYEGDMFRVQTEYGFALIRRDMVVSIKFEPDSAGNVPAGSREGTRASASDNPSAGKGGARVTSATQTAVKIPPRPSKPLDKPLPANIQERVEGTEYVNETFHFSMYKPPGWKIYGGISHDTGRAIVALATEDERTLLIVDRQVWTGAPDLHSDSVEENLRQAYQDFSKESESPAQLDGRAAIRRSFTGLLDGAEWHGVAIHAARGNTLFGIIGLTSAETYQFQQAVFSKIIKSFRFTGDTPEGTASP
jgi:hypothetical protein